MLMPLHVKLPRFCEPRNANHEIVVQSLTSEPSLSHVLPIEAKASVYDYIDIAQRLALANLKRLAV